MLFKNEMIPFRVVFTLIFQDTFFSKNPLYHARCRNAYTNRKTVEQKCRAKLKRYEEEDSSQCGTAESSKVSTRSTHAPVQFKEECFVCRKTRDKKGDRKLILVSTTNRHNLICTKAKELKDNHMLQILQGFGESCADMVASDFRYHKSCLTSYMNRKLESTVKTPSAHDTGFMWLV